MGLEQQESSLHDYACKTLVAKVCSSTARPQGQGRTEIALAPLSRYLSESEPVHRSEQRFTRTGYVILKMKGSRVGVLVIYTYVIYV